MPLPPRPPPTPLRLRRGRERLSRVRSPYNGRGLSPVRRAHWLLRVKLKVGILAMQEHDLDLEAAEILVGGKVWAGIFHGGEMEYEVYGVISRMAVTVCFDTEAVDSKAHLKQFSVFGAQVSNLVHSLSWRACEVRTCNRRFFLFEGDYTSESEPTAVTKGSGDEDVESRSRNVLKQR